MHAWSGDGLQMALCGHGFSSGNVLMFVSATSMTGLGIVLLQFPRLGFQGFSTRSQVRACEHLLTRSGPRTSPQKCFSTPSQGWVHFLSRVSGVTGSPREPRWHRVICKALRTGPRQHRQGRSLGVVTGPTIMSEVAIPDTRVFTRTDKEVNGLCTGPVARSPRGDRWSPTQKRVSSRCATPVHGKGTHRAVG